MYIRRNIRLSLIWKFAWWHLLFYLIYGSAIVWVFHALEHNDTNISLPFQPISVIGIAVAFYLSFKNSQAYDRFWEGRKIWGGIVNYSRTWAVHVLSFVSNAHTDPKLSPEELKKVQHEMIYRHIGWMNALRIELRKPNMFSLRTKGSVKNFNEKLMEQTEWQENVQCFLENGIEDFSHHVNPPAQILKKQGERLRELREEGGLIDDFRHMEMMRMIEEFYNLQGKCERINNTPFPRQYAYFSKVFVWIFILLLPFGLVGEFSKMGHGYIMLVVPVFMIISWIFMTIELVGDNSEDPFEGRINDVPMSAICRTIEIDLKQMLGETELPAKIEPVADILM